MTCYTEQIVADVPLQRLRIGRIPVDVLTFDDAVEKILDCAVSHRGGYVVTPNIDHVVMADTNENFRKAYEHATYSLVDGQPLVWASRLMGCPFPAKISGADLIRPLMKRAGEKKMRVYFLGGMPTVAEKAANVLQKEYGIEIAGCDDSMISNPIENEANQKIIERAAKTKPHFILFALGAPKQELLMHTYYNVYAPAVGLGIGAGLDFIAGTVKRAPEWMSKSGLEWAYRLSQEPKRLWRRYLINDPKFVVILAKTLARPKSERIQTRA